MSSDSSKTYRRDCLLGALLMLIGDLCLSVIPAAPTDSGLFLREAYLSGAYPAWRLPLLVATGLPGMALGFFTVRASCAQIRPQYRKTRLTIRISGVIHLTSAGALHLFIGSLADWTRTLGRCVSYDGFDETESSEFPSMLAETEKIEAYVQQNCGGHIRAAYGCSLGGSLGGSFVGLLAARGKIHMDYGILGSSDLNQASKLAAGVQTGLFLPLLYPLVRDGKFRSRLLQKRLEKRAREMPAYVGAFMEMFGGARPYVTLQSCKNQFYSDLITPLPEKLDVPGTEFHIFYARKMGEKYRARYERHFARPVMHGQNLQHEELLACYPEQWAALVKAIAHGKEAAVWASAHRCCAQSTGFPG